MVQPASTPNSTQNDPNKPRNDPVEERITQVVASGDEKAARQLLQEHPQARAQLENALVQSGQLGTLSALNHPVGQTNGQAPVVLAQANGGAATVTGGGSPPADNTVRPEKVRQALDHVAWGGDGGSATEAQRMADVLQGRQFSDLSAAERQQVLQTQAMRWTYAHHMFDGTDSLTALPGLVGASTNPQMRHDIATAYMNAAVAGNDRMPGNRSATTAALAFQTDPAAAMQALTSKPDSLARLASNASQQFEPGQAKLFETLATVPPSAERDLLIRTTFLKTSADTLGRDPALQASTAKALAATQFPNDPVRAAAATRELTTLLSTESGRSLLADTKVNPAARLWALNQAVTNPAGLAKLTGNSDKPWEQAALVEAHGRARFDQYAVGRGNGSVPLAGTNLENMIGAGMGAPLRADAPKTDAEFNAASELARNGQYSFYQGFKPVEQVAEGVRKANQQMGANKDDPARVAFIPVQYSSQDTGPVDFTLYRVDGANGQSRYVDNEGRIYQNFDQWRNENRLPPGVMTFPEGGRLGSQPGETKLVTQATPKTVDTPWEHVTNFLDKATLVGGVVAGVGLIFVSGGTAALVLGGVAIGSAAYQGSQAAGNLIDRHQHGQSISLADADARAAWLSLAASGLAVGGSAASVVARTATSGSNVAVQSARLAGILNTSANFADAATVVDQGANLALNWNQLSPQERAQIGLNMAFWGAMTVANTRGSGAQLRDMFDFRAQINRSLIDTGAAVSSQPTLKGNAVEVKYSQDANGRLTGIRIEYGPNARPEDIRLHQQTAQAMLGADGLKGLLDSHSARNGQPKPGTLAWEARHEVDKISTALQRDLKLLNSGNLTPSQRTDLQMRITDYRAELAYQRVIAERMLETPGIGAVGLPSAGSVRAQAEGLPNPPAGYHWAQQGDQLIVRSNSDSTRRQPLAYDPATRNFVPVNANVAQSNTVGTSQPVGISNAALQAQIDAQIARREVYRNEVNALEAQQTANGGTLPANDELRLRQAYAGRSQTSEQIGELGAEAAVRQRFGIPASQSPIYGGPGNGPGKPGTFDQVWVLPPTRPGGPERLLVVEAKGGTADLGTRRVGGTQYEQGTPQYLDDVIRSMKSDPATRAVALRLEAARNNGTLEYYLAKTPIKDQPSGPPTANVVNLSQFDLR